jgi:predicted ArsR family transcriptional regulator
MRLSRLQRKRLMESSPAVSEGTTDEPDRGFLRDATSAEMRALANPLRLRILRYCLDGALTNQELARRLGRDPGTVLFHVRALVDQGFLAPEPERPGPRGRTERPYRSTGKSWAIRLAPNAGHTAATLEAVRQEVVDSGEDGVITTVRLGVRLNDADIAELRRRLQAIGDDFADRDTPDGQPIGLLLTMHRRRTD